MVGVENPYDRDRNRGDRAQEERMKRRDSGSGGVLFTEPARPPWRFKTCSCLMRWCRPRSGGCWLYQRLRPLPGPALRQNKCRRPRRMLAVAFREPSGWREGETASRIRATISLRRPACLFTNFSLSGRCRGKPADLIETWPSRPPEPESGAEFYPLPNPVSCEGWQLRPPGCLVGRGAPNRIAH